MISLHMPLMEELDLSTMFGLPFRMIYLHFVHSFQLEHGFFRVKNSVLTKLSYGLIGANPNPLLIVRINHMQGKLRFLPFAHSHSIVAGGLELMS